MSEPIAVIGAGQMGSGIAHVAAVNGYMVTMIDVAGNMERQVKKGTLDATARDAALSRIVVSTKLDAAAAARVVIEAATERADLKFRIFGDLDRIAQPGAILATNTSSI